MRDLDLACRALLGAAFTASPVDRNLRVAAARELLIQHFDDLRGRKVSELALRLANATTGKTR